jgi:hypothetical protein
MSYSSKKYIFLPSLKRTVKPGGYLVGLYAQQKICGHTMAHVSQKYDYEALSQNIVK